MQLDFPVERKSSGPCGKQLGRPGKLCVNSKAKNLSVVLKSSKAAPESWQLTGGCPMLRTLGLLPRGCSVQCVLCAVGGGMDAVHRRTWLCCNTKESQERVIGHVACSC